MDRARHARVRELYDAASALSGSAREAFLDGIASDDPGAGRDVRQLLASAQESGTVLHRESLQRVIAEVIGDSADSLGPGARIGPYSLVRVIERGGMGIVFEGLQQNPKRRVAIKVMRAGLATPALRRRFEQESQFLALLTHPGIAQVFESGTCAPIGGDPHGPTPRAPIPYFAMEYVESARTITAFAAGAGNDPLTRRERLGLFARVCDAVQYAHQRGVIHRDLKPANILVDASGNPKVIDFGVARAIGAEITLATQTSDGQLVGTLQYMSPEQCIGDASGIDTRTDVFGLGLILYELLLARPARRFESISLTSAVAEITSRDPPRPSDLDPTISPDLETITLKALSREPEGRYQSVAQLASDIRHVLADETISARRPTTREQLRRVARRHRSLVIASGVTLITLLLGVTTTTIQSIRASRHARRADEAARAAQMGQEAAQRQAYAANIAAADAAIKANDGGTALRRLEAVPEDRRHWEWNFLAALADRSRVLYRQERVWAALPAGAQSQKLMMLDAGAMVEMDTATGRVEKRPYRVSELSQLQCISADGARFAYTSGAGYGVRRTADGELVREWSVTEAPNQPVGLALNADGTRLFMARTDTNERTLIDVDSGRVLWSVAGTLPAMWPRAPKFTRDGSEVFMAEDPYLSFFAVLDGRRTRSWEVRPGAAPTFGIHQECISDDGSRVAVALNNDALLFDAYTGALIREFKGHTQRAQAIALDEHGHRLITGAADKTLRVWDCDRPEPPRVLLGHRAHVARVGFLPGDRGIWSSGADLTVRTWDTAAQGPVTTLPLESRMHVRLLRFDGEETLQAAQEHALLSLPFRRGDAPRSPGTQEQPQTPGRFWAAHGPFDEHRDARLTEDANGAVLWLGEERIPDDGFLAFAWCPLGDRVAWFLDDRSAVYLQRDPRLGGWLRLAESDATFASLVFTHDGSRLLASGETGGIRVWNTTTGACERRLVPPGGSTPVAVTVSPDGSRVAAGNDAGLIFVWDMASGQLLRQLSSCESDVFSLAFSPDGARLASGSYDRTVRVWDTESGDELLQLRQCRATPISLAWSLDGRRLAAGMWAIEPQTITVWDSDPSTHK